MGGEACHANAWNMLLHRHIFTSNDREKSATNTFRVAWLSISCQALSNCHSCELDMKRSSASATVSFAAAWNSEKINVTSTVSEIIKRSHRWPAETSPPPSGTRFVRLAPSQLLHGRVEICRLSYRASSPILSVVAWIHSTKFGTLRSLPGCRNTKGNKRRRNLGQVIDYRAACLDNRHEFLTSSSISSLLMSSVQLFKFSSSICN